MKTLKFKKIDAFTKGSAAGNPAGYIHMNSDRLLNVQEMQRIAAELKGFVNEVGFVNQIGTEYHLRFYSSECEVAFCGHATIAIMYDLLKSNQELLQKKAVQIHVNAGTLAVLNHIAEEDAVYIMAPAPKFFDCTINAEQISGALGTPSSHIDDTLPIRLIDGGLRTLLVPIKTIEGCLGLCPNQENLRLFCLENGIDIIHVSTKESFMKSCRYRTRVFAPKYGYLEDPATGSGNAAFGYYLINENRWDGAFTIAQGPNASNPNFVKLRKSDHDGIGRIQFGGCATTRIEGDYLLHSR